MSSESTTTIFGLSAADSAGEIAAPSKPPQANRKRVIARSLREEEDRIVEHREGKVNDLF